MLTSRGTSLDYYRYAFNAPLFMEGAFKLAPDDWQADLLLRSPDKMLLLCSRQSGKSTVCATMALHRAVFFPSSLVLIVSNVFRQAEETFRKVKAGLSFVYSYCGINHETQTMLELSNGSRIVSLPGKQESIRSFSSVSLLIIDEAAQVGDDLYRSVRPMLAVSRGRLVALSTPYGKRGWFYDSWSRGDEWYKVKVTAEKCPRISSTFLEDERKEIGEWWVKQEYMCEFVDADDQLFSHDSIMDAVTDEVIPIIF